MKYIIEEKLANAVLNYLVNRPYVEVANLIQGLHTMVPYQDGSGKDLKSMPVIPPPGSDNIASPFTKAQK